MMFFLVSRTNLIPQLQITNCRWTASFSGDFDTIIRRLHGYRPVAAQFERWQFKFKTPSGAVRGLEKSYNWTATGRFIGPSESPLTHQPGSVRALPGDQTMPLEIWRRPDNFYEKVHLKIGRWPECLRPGAGLRASRARVGTAQL